MSNVIDFSAARRKRYGHPGDGLPSEGISSLALGDSTITATLLLENLDNPHLALAKAAEIIAAMPDAFARDCALEDLERLRARLLPAHGGELRDIGPDAA